MSWDKSPPPHRYPPRREMTDSEKWEVRQMALFNAWTVLHEVGSADLAVLLALRTRVISGPYERRDDAEELSTDSTLLSSGRAFRDAYRDRLRRRAPSRFAAAQLVWWSCCTEDLNSLAISYSYAMDQIKGSFGLLDTRWHEVDGPIAQGVLSRQIALRNMLRGTTVATTTD